MVTYKDAGVDIDASNKAMSRIRSHVKSTFNKNVLVDIGNFGGLYNFEKEKYSQPVLVSSSDGVGTKLKLAYLTGKHDTVGRDLVNHCVNDILVMGATPLYFLDYIGTGKLEPGVVEQIVKGFSIACKENNTALIGGETAELPGLYKENEYDLAGFIVGVAEKEKILTGKDVKPGDAVIGISSNGLHTNGYSLALKVLHDRLDEFVPELMKVHLSYLKPIAKLMKALNIKAMAHITGGGLLDNIPRVLPNGCAVELKEGSWEIPKVFTLIQKLGDVPADDVYRTFNMGIGFVVIVDNTEAERAIKIIESCSHKAHLIGTTVNGKKKEVKILTSNN